MEHLRWLSDSVVARRPANTYYWEVCNNSKRLLAIVLKYVTIAATQ